MDKLPELLAPCGSPDTLDAAIKSGADAVYLGGTILNARMNAENFNNAVLKSSVQKCHDNGVKIYVTLNTLVYDREFDTAVRYAAELYEIGVDALIIADIGLAGMIHEIIPEFELHASTQMSGHNAEMAKALYQKGFSRMVCARELTRDEIGCLKRESPVGIEMFIHGAHCVSVSGQCLMSSLIGGRSGNRGDCAQPCRMKYNGGYPLSLKDMCLAGHISEIIDLGIDSLKIEGRMKSADYVYSVTSIYRRLLDERRNADENEISQLMKIFSRSGFTDGYYTGKINPSMLGIRTESDKESTKNVKIVHRKLGEIREPLTVDRGKVELPDNKIKSQCEFVKRQPLKSARFYNAEQIPDNHGFDIVYLPLADFNGHKANGVVLPCVIKDSEKESVKNKLRSAVNNGAEHVYVGNLGHAALCGEFDLKMHGDFRLNVFNNEAMRYYNEIFEDVILSPELTLPQIRDIGGRKSVIIYGRIPMMILEKSIDTKSLKDRTNTVFPILKEGKRELICNSVPVYTADKKSELKKAGVVNTHYIFTVETADEVLNIIRAYDKELPPKGNCRRIK